ncbi:unnamed protein product [Peniophora sp. CBMAI 1063]|nr:unnamed protein product [Peniophora sp. CBMAI 1063]
MSSVDVAAAYAPETEVLRGPGLLESIATVRHSLGFYTAVCCAARFSISSAASPGSRTGNASSTPSIPTLSLLYNALHDVIAQHPPLALGVQDESSPSVRFVRLSSFDLERLVHVEPLRDEVTRQRALNQLIEARLSTRFGDLEALPLWRLVVFLPPEAEDASAPGEVDIVLFIHHGIADGGSAVIFMQALLAAFNAAAARQPFEPLGTIVTPPKAALLPSIESLHALPVSFFTLLGMVWRSWFPASRAGLWTGKPVFRPEDTVQTRHAIRVFPAETAAKLLSAARAHKVTLTPLLEALVARALFDSLPDDGHAKRLAASCPINMRAFMPDLKHTIGVFVASDEHEFVRGGADADVWKDAERLGSQLARTVAYIKQGKHVNTGLLRYMGDMRQNFEKKVGKPRDRSFEVSNTGSVDGSGGEQGSWSMKQLMFTQSGSITGEALTFSVSSVRGGPMTVAVSWVEGVVDEPVVDKTLEKLVSLVNDVCSGKM